MEATFRIGISSCLLGNEVRWNAGHKLDKYLTRTLGQFVEYVPVCPEVEVGLGIPRESMRLVGDPDKPRLITFKSKTDHTDRMVAWAKKRVKELEKEDLCGFVFKSDSPSSGMIRVKVYNEKGMPHKIGIGIFARAFMEHFPLIPVEDDGRLNDPLIRENFILQIFTMKRWRENLACQTQHGQPGGFSYPQQASDSVAQSKTLSLDGQTGRRRQEDAHQGIVRPISADIDGSLEIENNHQKAQQCFAAPDGLF